MYLETFYGSPFPLTPSPIDHKDLLFKTSSNSSHLPKPLKTSGIPCERTGEQGRKTGNAHTSHSKNPEWKQKTRNKTSIRQRQIQKSTFIHPKPRWEDTSVETNNSQGIMSLSGPSHPRESAWRNDWNFGKEIWSVVWKPSTVKTSWNLSKWS